MGLLEIVSGLLSRLVFLLGFLYDAAMSFYAHVVLWIPLRRLSVRAWGVHHELCLRLRYCCSPRCNGERLREVSSCKADQCGQ